MHALILGALRKQGVFIPSYGLSLEMSFWVLMVGFPDACDDQASRIGLICASILEKRMKRKNN